MSNFWITKRPAYGRYTKSGGYKRSAYVRRMRGKGTYHRSTHPSFQQEMKFHEDNPADAVISATGTVSNSMVLIPQGVTEVTRIGRKVIVRKLMWRIAYGLPAVTAQADIPNGDIIRTILFVDKQANGANTTVTDILETADVFSFMNLANKGRFRILKDFCFAVNRRVAATDGSNTSTSPAVVIYKTYRNFKLNIPIEFDSTAGAITEITSNNIAHMNISLNGVATMFQSEMRIRFDG